MPDCLSEFLIALSEQDRRDVWEWFDADPNAVEKVQELIAEVPE